MSVPIIYSQLFSQYQVFLLQTINLYCIFFFTEFYLQRNGNVFVYISNLVIACHFAFSPRSSFGSSHITYSSLIFSFTSVNFLSHFSPNSTFLCFQNISSRFPPCLIISILFLLTSLFSIVLLITYSSRSYFFPSLIFSVHFAFHFLLNDIFPQHLVTSSFLPRFYVLFCTFSYFEQFSFYIFNLIASCPCTSFLCFCSLGFRHGCLPALFLVSCFFLSSFFSIVFLMTY